MCIVCYPTFKMKEPCSFNYRKISMIFFFNLATESCVPFGYSAGKGYSTYK